MAKLSEAQWSVLNYMARGAEVWCSPRRTHYWYPHRNYRSPPLATVNALARKGFVENYAIVDQKYRITEAGRLALGESEK